MRIFENSSRQCRPNKIDMNFLVLHGFLLLGFGMATVQDVLVLGSGPALVAEHEVPRKRCQYSRSYSMLQVRCSGIDLERIPQDLKTDIQILDLSRNRIRALTNDSLTPYSNLAYLYLGENFILDIEEGAFAQQRYLEVLDLTKNGFDRLPNSLFQLPYLRKLYLSDIRLSDALFHVEVNSPLNFLQLSKNRFSKIPEIGPLPSLVYLNLSSNVIGSVSPEDLAGFCSLKSLDLSGNPLKFDEDSCDCQLFKNWLSLREIVFRPASFNCSKAEMERCKDAQFSNRTLELYEECSNVLKSKLESEKARSTWILVASCVTAFIVCVFIGLYCVHKRNKKRRKKLKEQQRMAVNNANTELLNSNLQTENT